MTNPAKSTNQGEGSLSDKIDNNSPYIWGMCKIPESEALREKLFSESEFIVSWKNGAMYFQGPAKNFANFIHLIEDIDAIVIFRIHKDK